jgi:hypothetical protein
MTTATSSNGEERLSDALTCHSQCQSQQNCNFVQWNNSTGICQFFNGDIEELSKDKESVIGARDCKNIASLWKKKPIKTRTTAAAARTISSPSEATALSGAKETAPPQDRSANTRYICHYRESIRNGRLLVADFL